MCAGHSFLLQVLSSAFKISATQREENLILAEYESEECDMQKAIRNKSGVSKSWEYCQKKIANFLLLLLPWIDLSFLVTSVSILPNFAPQPSLTFISVFALFLSSINQSKPANQFTYIFKAHMSLVLGCFHNYYTSSLLVFGKKQFWNALENVFHYQSYTIFALNPQTLNFWNLMIIWHGKNTPMFTQYYQNYQNYWGD